MDTTSSLQPTLNPSDKVSSSVGGFMNSLLYYLTCPMFYWLILVWSTEKQETVKPVIRSLYLMCRHRHNQPIPAYVSIFPPVPVCSSLFLPILFQPTYSCLFKLLPATSKLVKPIPAYSCIFHLFSYYFILFRHLSSSSIINVTLFTGLTVFTAFTAFPAYPAFPVLPKFSAFISLP